MQLADPGEAQEALDLWLAAEPTVTTSEDAALSELKQVLGVA